MRQSEVFDGTLAFHDLLIIVQFARMPGRKACMSENPVSRYARLLSKGQLLQGNRSPEPGIPGTPQMYHSGLGRFFVGRAVLDQENRLTIEYAPDPERVLELAATAIRRGRFGSSTYDQEQ